MTLTSSACLVLTLSRGGWLGFLAMGFLMMVLMVFWLSPKLPPLWQKLALPLLFAGTAGVVVAAVLLVPPVRERVMSIFAMRGDSSNNFRFNVYAAVFEMIRDRPFFGIGPGNEAFNQIYPFYQRPNRSEEHTSELQSPVPISYAVFCLKKKNYQHLNHHSSVPCTLAGVSDFHHHVSYPACS